MKKEDEEIFSAKMHRLADVFERYARAAHTRPHTADLENDREVVNLRDDYLAFADKIFAEFKMAGYDGCKDWNGLMEKSGAKKRIENTLSKYP